MNTFNERQRRVINDIAGHYFDTRNTIDIMPEWYEKHKQHYIDAIIQGLTDPEYWGNDEQTA